MRALFLVTLVFMSSCQAKDQAQQALEDANRLAANGDYAAALSKHVWFHENALKIRPSYYGVRLSFALSYWIELGKKYPKALEKLKEIRDSKTQRLLKGERSRDLFHDVSSINEYLQAFQSTADLFKELDTTDPKFASTIYDLADAALLSCREFGLAKKYLGDPNERLREAREHLERGIRFAKGSKNEDASRHAFERIFAEEVVRTIIVLRETGDRSGAKAIQEEALKVLANPSIREALEK
jgi:tetratricopeptide (TPR) repeat protein